MPDRQTKINAPHTRRQSTVNETLLHGPQCTGVESRAQRDCKIPMLREVTDALLRELIAPSREGPRGSCKPVACGIVSKAKFRGMEIDRVVKRHPRVVSMSRRRWRCCRRLCPCGDREWLWETDKF